MHFVNSAIGLVAGLLDHHRPIQRSDRAVSAEHGHAVLAFADGEFVGGGELHLVAFVHKAADDLEVLHVLAGGILGRGCRH